MTGMKTCLMILLLAVASAAQAQGEVRACKDERGRVVYENSDKAAGNCRKVQSDSLSVIPPSPRKKRLPISIGMSQDQVRNNWGKPDRVSRTQSRNGVTEQWVYAGGTLTFANGVLEVIQN